MSLSLYPTPGASSSKSNNLPPTLASSFRDRSITLPNFSTLKTKDLRSGHRSSVRGLGWSIDGRKLATCGADRVIRIWVPERSVDHRASTELRGHAESVDQLAWNPTHPEVLASASGDRTVRIWDTRGKGEGLVVATPGANINIAYHPTGEYIAVGDKTDTVSIIDSRQQKVVHTVCSRRTTPPTGETSYTNTTVLGSGDEINELTYSPDGSLLLLSSGNGSVHIHHTTHDHRRVHSHPTHTANVFCLHYDPLSRYIATASSDAMIGLWHSTEWYAVKMITSLTFPARAIGFSWDGELLAAAGEDAYVSINATAGAGEDQVHRLALAAGTVVNTLAWHPSRYVLAYAGDEPGVKDVGCVRVFGLQ